MCNFLNLKTNRKKQFLLFLMTAISIGISFFSSNAYAFNTYNVGQVINGKAYNDTLKIWKKRNISISVGYTNKSGRLFFVGETSLSDATVVIDYLPTTQERLERFISTAIKWADIAKKNKADVSKPLGCFGDDLDGFCDRTGNVFNTNQLGFNFFSAKSGSQVNLILSFIDKNNKFINEQIYLELPEIKKLFETISLIPKEIEKAKKKSKASELFQMEKSPEEKNKSNFEETNLTNGLHAIRKQIVKCWNPPIGFQYSDTTIDVQIKMSSDGTPKNARILFPSKDMFLRTAEETLKRAINNNRCWPYPLPIDDYTKWETLNISISSSDFKAAM